jgi:hypothetical protein
MRDGVTHPHTQPSDIRGLLVFHQSLENAMKEHRVRYEGAAVGSIVGGKRKSKTGGVYPDRPARGSQKDGVKAKVLFEKVRVQ